ncbi:ABC transporter ATP-binding protein [Oceaniglobus trochenteri]|uniref:ABC transporter ATP-binding protein n=1 Tax=Oceaniglobus trochenteri TaxID=2763260 RepID=UPI001CFFA70F|nr:oligopeptide/dipeptide ABC transporter ATP-binding protein [Oceaniglobus trochenteri]
MTVQEEPQDLLRVRNLSMSFALSKGFLGRVHSTVDANADVSFTVKESETLSVVGESGCGKTTLGRCIVGMYRPTGGSVEFRGEDGRFVDLVPLSTAEMKPYRSQIRMIFQDPFSSLNPRMSVLELIGEPLRIQRGMSGRPLEDRVVELLERVGLPGSYAQRYPHAFSGGERQRIGIARALALNPRLVVADECVSALDVSIQAQVLNLLGEIQKEFGIAYLFISHDLTVVRHISDRVAVMYAGTLVELADVKALFDRPMHPYTQALLSAAPRPVPGARGKSRRIRLEGEVADLANKPSGCLFHPRCRHARDRCKVDAPALRAMPDGRTVACHFAEEIAQTPASDV